MIGSDDGVIGRWHAHRSTEALDQLNAPGNSVSKCSRWEAKSLPVKPLSCPEKIAPLVMRMTGPDGLGSGQ